jgi:hypothetical protein
MVVLRNAVDTWVGQDAPNKNYSATVRLRARTTGGGNRYMFLFFTRPWPQGSTVLTGKLRLYNGIATAASVTLTAQRVSAKFSINKATYNNMPGVTGATATVVKATAAIGTEWEMDVQPLLQTIADGAAWYGIRVSSNSTVDNWWHSTQSGSGSKRPVLEVTWSMPPTKPDGLSPANGRATSLAKPIVRSQFKDPDGANTMASMQVQIDALNDFTTAIDFDTGEVATSHSQIDLSTTAYAGLAVDATTWWRTRHKDNAGLWSAWSDSVSFIRKAKGVLTITVPSSGAPTFWEGSPAITWTFTGTTQRAYQVIIAKLNDSNNWVWDTGKITSTATTVTVPFGKIKDTSLTYRVIVRIWDTIDREELPGDTAYVEALRDVTFAYDNAVLPVTSLAMSSDPIYPKANLTWVRASGAPTHWQIQRSNDAGTTWTYLAEYLGADLSTGGTNYAVTDNTASPYVTYMWRVLAVVAGIQSGTNPTVSGSTAKLAPVLMREDGTDPVLFLNPQRTSTNLDVQELHEVLGNAPPVVVTQKLGGKSGHVEGALFSNIVTGVTAAEFKRRFLSIRADTGVPMILHTVDEARRVVPYNMNYDVYSSNEGIYYLVSFDYVEV